MALTIDSTREWYGDRMTKGLRITHFTAKVGATGDYSTAANAEGFDTQDLKAPLGIGSVCDVLACVVRSSTGTAKPYIPLFIPETNRLRLFKGSAGALVEVVPGTDLAVGDLLQMTVFAG
jgi:hypothetical protein